MKYLTASQMAAMGFLFSMLSSASALPKGRSEIWRVSLVKKLNSLGIKGLHFKFGEVRSRDMYDSKLPIHDPANVFPDTGHTSNACFELVLAKGGHLVIKMGMVSSSMMRSWTVTDVDFWPTREQEKFFEGHLSCWKFRHAIVGWRPA